MKKRILRLAALILTLLIILCSLCSCGKNAKEQLPTPTEKFFVNDFAQVLTEADANTIYTSGAALHEATTAQAVVVTVESLDGKQAADYALEIGREWGVGAEDKDNGVVILLSESDREIYISVGYGLEGALPDSKTGRIIDTYGISYFSNDNFSAGLLGIYNAIVNEIYIEYGMQPSENYVPMNVLSQSEEQVSAEKVAISWLVLIIIVVIYVTAFGRRGGLFLFGAPRFFGGNHFHGGGFGGSSGSFGGFRGGGGSFGGGGAGRKF